MSRTCAARIDGVDQLLVRGIFGEGAKDAFGHSGAANVAEADKKHGNLLGHLGRLLVEGVVEVLVMGNGFLFV